MKNCLSIIVCFMLTNCWSSTNRISHNVINGIYDKEVNLLKRSIEDSISLHSKILVYIDTAECSTCRVRNLIFWQDFIEEYKKIDTDIDMIFIISPKPEFEIEVEAIIYELNLRNVYIDKECEFIKQNDFLSMDKRLNTILLDKNNKIKLIDSPIGNVRLDKLYRKTIRNIKT